MKKALLISLLLVVVGASAAFAQPTSTVLYKQQIDTEAELEALITDVANIIAATEIDTEAELEAIITDVANLIVSTEIDTLAELNALLTDATLADGPHTDTSKLPLAGGILTGEMTADDLGIEFTPGDTLTDCSSFAATGGGIFYDDSEGRFKKCQDGVLEDLDTTGGTPAFSAITGGTNTAAAMVVGTGASLAPSGSGTITATAVSGTDAISDANVVDTLTAANYLPLAGGTMTGDITLSERASDPADPSEGSWICWMSNGVGSGADGDVLCKITAGGSTKFVTLFDFSAI